MTEGLCTYIKSKTTPLIAPQEVMNVVRAINNARLPETDATAQAHVARLKERFGPHQAGDPCPRCSNGRLVQRTPKLRATASWDALIIRGAGRSKSKHDEIRLQMIIGCR